MGGTYGRTVLPVQPAATQPRLLPIPPPCHTQKKEILIAEALAFPFHSTLPPSPTPSALYLCLVLEIC